MTTTMLNAPMVVIGMINGMLGGVILVLPLLTLSAGTLLSGIIILVSGIFSYYSSMLCVKHLGPYPDLDEAIMYHFNGSKAIKTFYSLLVFLNLSLLLILYFELIVQQWEGMFPYSIANPITNFFVLFFLVFAMKYYDFGASLLAYGIISIIGYCIFLVLMLATSPEGPKKMPLVGSGGVSMAASMGQAFSIQTFFIPILRKNNNPSSYQLYTFLAYLFGMLINTYIAYSGAYGLLQRTPVDPDPQTVEGYFQRGHWQLYSLEIVYLIHLYSVFPQFLLISKKRLFEAIGISNSEAGQIPIKEAIYTLILVGICLAASLAELKIEDLIEINGAVVSFFFIYFLPLITHLKCLYFTKHDCPAQLSIEITPVSKSESSLSRALIQEDAPHSGNASYPEDDKQVAKPLLSVGGCSARRGTIGVQVADMVMLVGMMGVGLFIMLDSLENVFFN